METHNSNLGRSLFAPFSLAAGAAVLFLFFLHNRIRQSKSTRRLPPGPRGWPIIGNILQIGPSPPQQHNSPTAQVWSFNLAKVRVSKHSCYSFCSGRQELLKTMINIFATATETRR
ncbi:hypothetical protein C5167_019599 [Papaver somniferum]|uniref:Cytochrome P450 n=1 Tax=Papaver somniferum TaxID=3469 RepID=A0A4Y7IQK9_PAPSO|nr:hypothetical protein C5167_019599 [Papaver somniferum]